MGPVEIVLFVAMLVIIGLGIVALVRHLMSQA